MTSPKAPSDLPSTLNVTPPVVFFDLDDTLLKGNSANLFIKYMLKRGELGWWDLVKGLFYTLLHKLNAVDITEVSASFVARYEGVHESTLIEACDDWFEKVVEPVIYEEAREIIESHREKGHKLVLLTASTVYACMPISRHLQFDHYIGTRLSVADGKLTGKIDGEMCYGPGKLELAKAFLREAGGTDDLAHCTFYSDSITDLPMLEAVGDPRVVNPDPLLAREAKRRGWPVRQFSR